MNNRLSIKNALNNESKFSYDNRNRLSSMKDAEENKTLYSYDGNGNVTHAFLPNGQVVDYTYDQLKLQKMLMALLQICYMIKTGI